MNFEKAQTQNRVKEMEELIKRSFLDNIHATAFQVAETMGFEMVKSDKPAFESTTYIFVSADGAKKYVRVSTRITEAWQYFALMHELAYYLSHYQPKSNKDFQHESTIGEFNNLAFTLATDMLVPKHYLHTVVTNFPDWTFPELEKLFNVPANIITTQLQAIGVKETK